MIQQRIRGREATQAEIKVEEGMEGGGQGDKGWAGGGCCGTAAGL